MQNFLQYERIEPQAKNVLERIKNFKEIYNPYTQEEASSQASRCIQCGDPYCSNKCPLHNYIPFWLNKVANSDLKLAFNISNSSSPFPEILGRICPQDRLCEKDCTLNDGHGAITIGSIETYISESAFEQGINITFPKPTTNKKVAIIGSGPAGLSCAHFLMQKGIKVEIFEKSDLAGGLLTYGIPNFKLDKSIVKRRIKNLKNFGAKFHLNCEVGKDISLKDIQKRFNSIFIGTGAPKPRESQIKNSNANGCYNAMDFLVSIQTKLFNKNNKNYINVKDKNVVVIGGGDTTMDCVRTSIRESARSVTFAYRRGENDMRGSQKEYKNAISEGVKPIFFATPKNIKIQNKQVREVEFAKTQIINKNGNITLKEIPNSIFALKADILIFSLGFLCEEAKFIQKNNINIDAENHIIIDKSFKTSAQNIYAGGDCHRGSDLVVNAAYDGREAARHIAKDILG